MNLSGMDNCLELYKDMFPNSIKLTYKGAVTFELIDSILFIISTRLEIIEKDVTVRKKVYSILMECLQNLCSYIENHKAVNTTYDFSNVMLSIENENESNIYMINTGNFIPTEKIVGLKNWLDKINGSSYDELKQLYNKVLTNNEYSSKGGGGLGFIDMARKSNGNLHYSFEPVDDKYSFFMLRIDINKK